MDSLYKMTATEREWNSPPINQDYRDAKKLLGDFGITIPVPKFPTRKALQGWTKQEISARLA